jgi:hypothetical protein
MYMPWLCKESQLLASLAGISREMAEWSALLREWSFALLPPSIIGECLRRHADHITKIGIEICCHA